MHEQYDVDLSDLNTFALPCVARKVISFDSIDEVGEFFQKELDLRQEFLILGGGSNMLLPNQLDTTLLRFLFDSITYTEGDDHVLVEVEAGMNWDDLVADTVAKGYAGLENLSYIPGTVGAAPVQNIGAYGVELSDVLESVRVFDTVLRKVLELDNAECEFAYRDSLFKRCPERYCILSLKLRLALRSSFKLDYGELKSLLDQKDELSLSQVRAKVIEVRKAKLPEPKDLPNVGSFFKNPIVSLEQVDDLRRRFPQIVSYDLGDGQVKLAAGWLIDEAGWKGKSKGPVGVHKKQALVLINLGGATQQDVLALAREIQDSVVSMFSVRLEIEPKHVLTEIS